MVGTSTKHMTVPVSLDKKNLPRAQDARCLKSGTIGIKEVIVRENNCNNAGYCICNVADPGSGAFFTPGQCCGSGSGRIRNFLPDPD